jgi:RND superfamily putative drug exporter
MAIIRSRLWYHPQWFARNVPDPDIEGKRLDEVLAATALEKDRTAVGAPGAPGKPWPRMSEPHSF